MRWWGWGLVVAALTAAPWALSPFYLLLLTELLIWVLFAQSFNLLFGYAGLLSLGQSVFFGLGAYGVALTLIYTSLNPALALLIGVAAAAAVAALIGVFAVRIEGHGFIILTAVAALSFYLLAISLSPITGGDHGRTFILPPLGLDLSDRTVAYALIAIVVVGIMLALRWLIKTPFGRALTLVRENERRAAELGYATRWLKWWAFVVAGAIAGLAGTLFALFNRFVDGLLFHWLLSADVIIWTLVGGAGTLWGPVVGVFGFKLLEEFLSGWWAVGQPLLLGIALILVVRFFPDGLAGAWQVWARWWAKSKS